MCDTAPFLDLFLIKSIRSLHFSYSLEVFTIIYSWCYSMCKGIRAQPTTEGNSDVCMHMQVAYTKVIYPSSKHTCPYYYNIITFATKPYSDACTGFWNHHQKHRH